MAAQRCVMAQKERLQSTLLRAVVVELAAIAITIGSAGGGHGNYVAAKVLFPYSLALTHFTKDISSPLVAIAVAQFPAYGLALWMAGGERRATTRWVALAAVHVAAVVAAFRFADSAFTP